MTAWPVAGRLLPHALAVTDQPDSHNAEPETTAILLSRAARYLWGRAEHPTAMRLLERALAICQASLPADDPTTAQCLTTSFGLVLRDQVILTAPVAASSAPFRSTRLVLAQTTRAPPGASTLSPTSWRPG
jgi:hypothetical protein